VAETAPLKIDGFALFEQIGRRLRLGLGRLRCSENRTRSRNTPQQREYRYRDEPYQPRKSVTEGA
jgi:hypothetical protein